MVERILKHGILKKFIEFRLNVRSSLICHSNINVSVIMFFSLINSGIDTRYDTKRFIVIYY